MKGVLNKDDAIKIAKKRNENVNTVQEYNDSFYFYVHGEITEGGFNNGFIVEKKTGMILLWAEYFMDAKRLIVEIGEPERI